MSPLELLGSLSALRIRVAPNGGKLTLDPIAAVPADLLEQIKANKPEIMTLLEATKAKTPWMKLLNSGADTLHALSAVQALEGLDFGKIRIEADGSIVHSALILSDIKGFISAAREGYARFPYAFHLTVWAVKPAVDGEAVCVLLAAFGEPLPTAHTRKTYLENA